jgi:CRP/FNR family cyclic AMP-dependent transcriptional regulator
MDSAEQCRLLSRVAILASLHALDVEKLAQAVAWTTFAAGEEIIGHLNPSTHVYFLLEGKVRAELNGAHGRTLAVRSLRAGDHFGEIAALTGSPRSARVVAETSTLLAECPASTFLALMDANAGVARAVAASLARTVIGVTDRMFELASLEVRFRVYAELLRLSRHAEPAGDNAVLIRDAPTHEMIAAAIGAQREAVTRELRHLAASGLIRQTGRQILITSLSELKDMMRQRAGLTATQLDEWQG